MTKAKAQARAAYLSRKTAGFQYVYWVPATGQYAVSAILPPFVAPVSTYAKGKQV